jgi:type IV pilus assembly protein PilW
MRSGRIRGFNLPELMVSLTIGLLLLAAFLVILERCRREFATNESLGSLQDAARSAFALLSTDLEHAGFYGVRSTAETRLVGELPTGAHDCGVNFAVDLATPIEAANNAFAVGVAPRNCAPTASAGGARAGSDTLTVRYASLAARDPRPGRLQLYGHRLHTHDALLLFADGRAPGALGEHAEIRDVEIHTWYVANHSVGRRNWPALRVKSLTESGGAAQFRDEEVQPGVEDLQVEFGVADDVTRATSFLPPEAAGLRDRRVIAVRLWLRIRADTTERGYLDPRALAYADVSFLPAPAEATQRRLLFERTVTLRNTSTP